MDDLNLSLAGSGIHSAASSSRSRPGSAKQQLKRPNSVTDLSREVQLNEPCREKPVFGGSYQVRHKPVCTATHAIYSLDISDFET